MLPAFVSLSPPPPSPLSQHPPVLETLEAAAAATSARDQQQRSTTSGAPPPSPASPGDGMNPSLLVVAAVVLFIFVATASIHLLLRFLSRQSSSSNTSSSSLSAPFVHLRRRLSSSSSSSSTAAAASSPSPSSPPARHRGDRDNDDDKGDSVDSLPLFTLASSLAALPRSSPDCAVCLSRFHPDDLLRLLPSCRHAFHSACIDTWLRSSLSCPLCRSPIPNEPIPPPPHPPPPPPPAPSPHSQAAASDATNAAAPSDRSASYRIEIGSVSRRRTVEGDAPALQPNARSYSLGSSFEYVVEEEVEAVVSALAAHLRRQRQSKDLSNSAPVPPGDDVAESAGGAAGGSRNWLKDYLDRLVSSASSSFSSLRFSGRDSRRIDSGIAGAGGGSWDLEGNRRWPGEDDEITGAYNSFYRWLVGA